MRMLLSVVLFGVGAAGANAATIESSAPADSPVLTESMQAAGNSAAPAQSTPDPYDWLDHVQMTRAVGGHSGGGVGHGQKAGHGTSSSHGAAHASPSHSGSGHRGGGGRTRAPRPPKMR